MQVRFKLTEYEARSTRSRKALMNAMHFTHEELDTVVEAQAPAFVVCTGNQFARFIIDRHNMGGSNNIKSLDAKIISQPDLLDVRCRE